MKPVTLLIMAAGLGSRYGGNKQLDQVGPNGEVLMEYSIYDAISAGFNKIVFVIRDSVKETFTKMICEKWSGRAEVHFVCQEYYTLPEKFTPPQSRIKPYGTVHAVLCAKNVINEPFAVINADDYYGRDSFYAMAESLKSMNGSALSASMVAYSLKNTVSEHGSVTRGICTTNGNGKLSSVKETYKITVFPDGTIRDVADDISGKILDPQSLVSMNFWGFTPDVMEYGNKYFTDFLFSAGDELKKEYLLPTLVNDLMINEGMQVQVLSTQAKWFGMTYIEDKAAVATELKKLHESGFYPETL